MHIIEHRDSPCEQADYFLALAPVALGSGYLPRCLDALLPAKKKKRRGSRKHTGLIVKIQLWSHNYNHSLLDASCFMTQPESCLLLSLRERRVQSCSKPVPENGKNVRLLDEGQPGVA